MREILSLRCSNSSFLWANENILAEITAVFPHYKCQNFKYHMTYIGEIGMPHKVLINYEQARNLMSGSVILHISMCETF